MKQANGSKISSPPERRQKRTFGNKKKEMDDSLLDHITNRKLGRGKTIFVTVHSDTNRSVRQQIEAYYRDLNMTAIVSTTHKEEDHNAKRR